MTFLSKIVEREHVFFAALDRFCGNGLPVVLCGNGFIANIIKKFLNEAGIKLYCTAVSKKYLPQVLVAEENEVKSIEEILKEPGKFNYIIGFQSCDDSFLMSLKRNAQEILIFDPSAIEMSAAGFIDYQFCVENCDYLESFYASLNDSLSREILIAYLNQRISGKIGYLEPYYQDNPYFDLKIIKLSNKEIFVDCGAYDGDTVLSFLSNLKERNLDPAEKIYAFEPDVSNFNQLLKNTRHLLNVQCFQSGVWLYHDQLAFTKNGDLNSGINIDNSGSKVNVHSIDEIVENDAVTFIKMDIEGSEQQALIGAEKTIINNKPVLAICLYHRLDDLLNIPKYIKSLYAGYRFYLRWHHKKYAYEFVLYALPY